MSNRNLQSETPSSVASGRARHATPFRPNNNRGNHIDGCRDTPRIPANNNNNNGNGADHAERKNPISNSWPAGLSIVAKFDDLMLRAESLIADDVTETFLDFVKNQKKCQAQWHMAVMECTRLQNELLKANTEIKKFKSEQAQVRNLYDQEVKWRNKAEEERDCLERQMTLARDILFNDKVAKLPEMTREKLAFLNNSHFASADVPELKFHNNTTASFLSDMSCSRSEDDLDVCMLAKPTRKRTAGDSTPKQQKRRRSSRLIEINNKDTVVATTTLTVHKDGPITATSVIESVPETPSTTKERPAPRPPSSESVTPITTAAKLFMQQEQTPGFFGENPTPAGRSHNFVQKMVVRPETCVPCEGRIRFGKMSYRCKDCKIVCHDECRKLVPPLCVPTTGTPGGSGSLGQLSDYISSIAPMVPRLIVDCVEEIEARGLNELGLYRVPGSEKAVKMAKEKFLKGKINPPVSSIDVHVLCGTIKDFLRSLKEPIVTRRLWSEFVDIADVPSPMDVQPLLYEVIAKMPQANRDTLAYLMNHLKKVANSPDCKMNLRNLAKVFGPTIIGYSSNEPETECLYKETHQQISVMEYLLNLPSDYWSDIISKSSNEPRSAIRQTPSTDSLIRSTAARGFLTPMSIMNMRSAKKMKFFATPPKK